jgi:hypothetical protein
MSRGQIDRGNLVLPRASDGGSLLRRAPARPRSRYNIFPTDGCILAAVRLMLAAMPSTPIWRLPFYTEGNGERFRDCAGGV